MRAILRHFKGDSVLWGVVTLLATFSFLPVFSASTNLSYVVGVGTPTGYLLKHLMIVIFGFILMFLVHKIPYAYFKGISILLLPIVFLLLIYTASQGTVIAGANASRWIRIPIIGLSFQTSTLAFVSLMAYIAYYLSKYQNNQQSFLRSLLLLWLPIFVFVGLILPSNFSTAALLFLMAFVLAFLGQHPLRYLGAILLSGLVGLTIFILLAKTVGRFMGNYNNAKQKYQVQKQKQTTPKKSILFDNYGINEV